ncbi:MAG: hypothetical protein C0514_02855 [Candidatus Puniceispirillum sp.]|nr:hypothetical protein [Candidatus Puniceispirillum sp.]
MKNLLATSLLLTCLCLVIPPLFASDPSSEEDSSSPSPGSSSPALPEETPLTLRELTPDQQTLIHALCLELPDHEESGAYLPRAALLDDISFLTDALASSERTNEVLRDICKALRGKFSDTTCKNDFLHVQITQMHNINSSQHQEIERLTKERNHQETLLQELTQENVLLREKLSGFSLQGEQD